jgi:hypothetical protein
MDPNMPHEEKLPHMVAWWETNLELYCKLGLQKRDYHEIVVKSRILFRHGI